MNDSKPNYGPIPLNLHAALDALILGGLLMSPWMLGFSHHREASLWVVVLFAGGMGLNLITNYPLGLIKKLPMKWHRWVEFTTPGVFIAVPWLFFAHAGAMPWACTAAGALVVLNALFTREQGPKA
jgi:hypothetical protein